MVFLWFRFFYKRKKNIRNEKEKRSDKYHKIRFMLQNEKQEKKIK